MKPTTIKNVQFFRAVSPLSQPIADATHTISEIAFLVTRLQLVSGHIGESYLLSFHYSPGAISGALGDIRSLVEGRDVRETGSLIADYNKESEYFGHSGIHRWALGSINLAMWDAWARSLNQPVWRLFGTWRDRVPLYGSGGWLSYSIEELISEVTAYKKRGFRAVKIKVGSPEIDRDIERLRRVREAVGPDLEIMMDANQGMDVAGAIKLCDAARPIGIKWFEEPLPHTDFDGYAHLRNQTGVALAMGEREFDTVALRELIRRGGIDLWQPDILRLGSVEAWRDSAALAAANHLPVLPHYYKEYDVPLLMTVPNAFGAESFDWVDGIITHPILMQDGFAYPTDQPGWGFTFKDKYLAQIS